MELWYDLIYMLCNRLQSIYYGCDMHPGDAASGTWNVVKGVMLQQQDSAA